MAGKNLQIKLLFALLCLLLPLQSAGIAGQESPVVVLVSGEEQTYKKPVESFQATVGHPVRVVNLKTDLEAVPALMQEVLAQKPPLIFALGAKAAFVSKIWTKEGGRPPVVFAMVLNWEKFGLNSQDNMAGIAYHVQPGAQFIGLTLYAPQCKRIGVIYSGRNSAHTVSKGREAAGLLGLELVEEVIEQPEQFERAYRKMAGRIDALWLIPDPVAFTLENIAWLEERFVRDRLVCLGYSRNIAKEGAVVAVDPDLGNIGSQAAEMARDILEGRKTPAEIGIMAPLGTRMIVNRQIAEKIGLALRQEALDMATEIIE